MKKSLNSALYGMTLAVILALTYSEPARAQVTLTGTSYSQNFNGLGTGLPTGWTVRTAASASALGTSGATFINTAGSTTAWSDTGGAFKNCAAAAAGSAASTATQTAAADRALAIRQVGAFGDPGAAFVLQLNSTAGFTNFQLALDLEMLNVQARSTVWTIDYAIGAAPTAFTAVATFSDPAAFGVTLTNINFNGVIDDKNTNVWIRVVALGASTGGGSRDTFGIDNFTLTYMPGSSGSTPVGITAQPQSRTNTAGTTATFTVSASGTSPAFQWQRSSTNLSNDAHFYNVTTSTLTISNVAFGDAGNYTCYITNAAPSTTNTDIAILTVLDASAVFTITTVARTNTLAATPVDVVFNFVGNAYSITNVTATSGNLTLVQNGNLAISGSGSSRTVQITPTTSASGVAIITVLATSGGYTATSSLPVVVVPSSAVLMNDYFDYANGSITATSAGLWVSHGGTVGQMLSTNGELNVSFALSEDCNVTLIGQPYLSTSGLTLYSSFKVTFYELPTATGEYFGHFKDSASNFRGRVFTSTANAAAGTFRLAVGNTSGSTATGYQVAQDLNLGTAYTVVTRMVLGTDITTIWVNPTNEASGFVTAGDPITNGTITVVSYAIREASGIGKMTVDNLIVGTNFASVLPVTAPVLHAANDPAGLILTWSNPAYFLQTAPTLTNTFVAVCPSTSPYTNTITGTEQYFRLTTQVCP